MSYIVAEMWNSREGSRGESASELLIYDVEGTDPGDDEAGARAAVLGEAPAKVGGLFLQSIRHSQRGGLRWLFELEYGRRTRDPDKMGIDIEVTTATAKRQLSISTVASYAAGGGTAPDFHGAINVSKGKIDGVEAPYQEAKFGIRKWYSPDELTFAFWDTIFRIAGKVNSDTFLGLAAGEVLFEGAGCSYIYELDVDAEEQERVEVNYRFRFSPNVGSQTIHGITVAAKQGHDYLWGYFEDSPDDTAKLTVVTPRALYVERVVERTAFAPLGITLP
jgi:hypothetical protein